MVKYLVTAPTIMLLFWLVDPSAMLGGLFMVALSCGGLYVLDRVNRPLESELDADRRAERERRTSSDSASAGPDESAHVRGVRA